MGLGVGPGQALITGTLGSQRLIVAPGFGPAVGLRGEGPNDVFRDTAGREEFMNLYEPRLGVRREVDGRFMAYAGSEVTLRAAGRDEEAGISGGAVHAENPLSLLSVSKEGDPQRKAVGEAAWQTAIVTVTRSRDVREQHSGDLPTFEECNLTVDPQAKTTEDVKQLQLQRLDPSRLRGGPSSTACQDCGNQAKKDCSHLRCRTCCKSRGFICPTHVKSTWVPASKRRERQQAELAAAAAAGHPRPRSKRARTLVLATVSNATTSHTSTSIGTPPRSSDFNSSYFSQQDGNDQGTIFPPQVRTQAVFKCVRVTGIEYGSEEEYAYQTIVRIGGHIFKGVLYDEGFDRTSDVPNVADLHLGGRSTPSSSTLIGPGGLYGASGSALLEGMEI